MKNTPILLMLLIFVFSSCEEKDLVQEMAAFDQLFIPAYFFAYTGDMDRAKIAIYPLKRKWESIKKTYGDEHLANEEWKRTFNFVESWLDDAELSINDNEPLRSRIHLDHVRYELMDLRWREKIDYYLDDVWDFEATMDIVLETATDPMLGLMEWHEFQMCVDEMNLQWMELSNKVPDGEIYQFTSDDWVDLNRALKNMNREMEYLMTAVNTSDGCQFAEAAKHVEKAYLEFIYIFGDFDTIPGQEYNIDFAKEEI